MSKTLIVVFLILCSVSAVNWQASGNVTSSNWTIIWNLIQGNIATYVTSSYDDLQAFSQFLSLKLNQTWDPAWNVFIFKLGDPSNDALMYGYAFRRHWLWYNGYSYAGKTLSFIIWKDFKCTTWNSIQNSNKQSTFSPSAINFPLYQLLTNTINDAVQPTYSYSDPWAYIYSLAQVLLIKQPTHDYTHIICQAGNTATGFTCELYGTFCNMGERQSYLFTSLNWMASPAFDNGRALFVFIQNR